MSRTDKGFRNYVRQSKLFRSNFLTSAGVILISFVLMAIAILLFGFIFLSRTNLDSLRVNALHVAEYTADALSSSDSDSIISGNVRQMSNAISADVFITDTDGQVIFCREYNSIRQGVCIGHSRYHISEETLSKCRTTAYSGTGNLEGNMGRMGFIAAAPVVKDGKTVAIVFITQDRNSNFTSYLFLFFRIFAVAAAVALVISFFSIYAITLRSVKPLKLMSDAAKQYSEGDFSQRIPLRPSRTEKNTDEMDELTDTFNSMASALSSLENSRRSFVANVSHELKTPMTTIGGFIDGILDGTIPPEKQRTYLKVVSDEVQRLSRLVRGMLAMSRIESGESTLNPVVFDMQEMIFKTLFSFEQLIENKHIDIRGLDKLSETKVKADSDMINQVVFNLIDNAVKFTPDGGYIEVTCSRADKKATVRIRNSGQGIEPDEQEKIFERFYKVDKSRSFDVKGAGMGLYIVRTLTELNGGKISVNSTPGEYAEFVFTVPLA